MFAAGHTPRIHLTACAKSIALQAIRAGRIQHRPASGAAARPAERPLVNRFGRPYLPIDKDVPLPDSDSKTTARPFALLAIGESFFEPCGALSPATLAQRIKWDAKAHRPKLFNHFETTEGGQPGLRVWRVA